MKTKIQIKSVFGKILFEYEKENNTVKDTVVEAIKRGSNLSYSDLRGSNLRGTITNEETAFFEPLCPSDGSFIGWKKANNQIIKLLITEDAKRSNATTLKCRCSKAKVLAIENINGDPTNKTEICSDKDPNFIYKVGNIVEVENFDENRWNECSYGIHFFISRNSAVNY